MQLILEYVKIYLLFLEMENYIFTILILNKKTIEIFTPQRIIFGSDTRIFPNGYRANVLREQKAILDELSLTSQDKEDIMRNNAKRIFNI